MLICLSATPTVQRTMTFDRLVIDSVNRAVNVEQYASGKSINVARVLNVLGHDSMAIGFVGGDSGRSIRQDLDAQNVAHDFIDVPPGTRTCVTVIDRSAGTATELIEESSEVPVESYLQLEQKLQRLLKQAKGLVLSGTLTPGAPPDFYARCVAAAVGAGVTVILDAKGEPLRRALPARPTVVKPNRQELQETVGLEINSEESLKQAIRKLLSQGPKWAVVTDGPGTTVVSDGSLFWKISSPKIQVVNPIGSGDSFAAGLMAGIAAGQLVPQACRLAIACGAANAMTLRTAEVNLTQVQQLLPDIVLTISPP